MIEATQTTNRDDARPAGATALVVALTAHEPWQASSRHLLAGVAQVEVRRGPRAIERSDGGGRLVIALPDRCLSGLHGALRLDGERWMLEDTGSKNGVFRNGAPVVDRVALEDGDVIEMGRSFFVFRAGPAWPEGEPLDVSTDALPAALPGLASLAPGLAARFADLARAAASELPILLSGETGTGKEIAARAVHAVSRRREPLVAVNCGGLPRSLLEAELFGSRRGSFSGATQDRVGLIAASHRGTLFLDEVAELPLDGQAALLRVLQDHEVTAIGSTQPEAIDLRVISATHRDLAAAVANGQFRADLYQRIAGLNVVLPPLRERREDLAMIAHAILARLRPGTPYALSHAAARALFLRTWPGNARELARELHAAIVMARGSVLDLVEDPEAAAAPPPDRRPRLRAHDRERRAELERLLGEHRGNVASVARALGKPREQVHRWIKRTGLVPDQFRV